jgi:hypothetical protein
MKPNENEEKKTTSEKPVSLSPLGFQKAVGGLLEVESNPCWKEDLEFIEAIEDLKQPEIYDIDAIKQKIAKLSPEEKEELENDPSKFITPSIHGQKMERIKNAIFALLECQKEKSSE